ncbi:MAG: PAS domain S-box protein [Deltaproteobacteria bacterium]|nr:PAS domain S-box protein [Deltaproteobacteria bacterium]
MQDRDDKSPLGETSLTSGDYRQLVDNLGDMLFRCDREGRFVFVSEAVSRLSMYEPQDLLGKSFLDFVHPEDRPRVAEGVARTMSGLAEPHEFRVLDKDGTIRHARTSGRAVYEGDELVGVVGILSDLTELRRAERARSELEEQLQQSQKMEALGRLASGVAHDFNNLLFIIQNYAAALRKHFEQDQDGYRQARAIERAAERAAELTRRLLVFSRVQDRRFHVVDLNKLLSETEPMLRRILGEDVGLTTRMAKELAPVKVDPACVDQVLINLAANARDAMAAGGHLTIETHNIDLGPEYAELDVEPGSFVELSVSDTGCGMTPEVQARAMEPFFTTKPAGEGTGLGLSTVYSTVRQSGGLVRIESRPHEGTKVSVFFPSCSAQLALETEGEQLSESAGAVAGQSPRKALLVEDEPLVREIVRVMLDSLGYTVSTASSVGRALEQSRLNREDIDLLLTDLVLTDSNGRQLAEQLLTERPATRVLFMTGHSDDSIARLYPTIEAPLLRKPFSKEELYSALDALFRSA